jgi:hypothetical protein
MKRTIFFGILMIFMMSASMAFAGKTELNSASKHSSVVITDSKLSAAEITVLTDRVEAIRSMDKSNMTVVEKRELRKELKGIKENVRKDGGVIYISGSVLLLIIILIIIL